MSTNTLQACSIQATVISWSFRMLVRIWLLLAPGNWASAYVAPCLISTIFNNVVIEGFHCEDECERGFAVTPHICSWKSDGGLWAWEGPFQGHHHSQEGICTVTANHTGGGGGVLSILTVVGTCCWTGYDFPVITIDTGYLNRPNWLLAGYSVYHRVASQLLTSSFVWHI